MRMNNQDFYDIIDAEIQTIVDSIDDEEIKKKSDEGKKAYCFLLWFLQNNLNRTHDELKKYTQYIVDGNDDNSCDLIFPNKEGGELVYYIIQAPTWYRKMQHPERLTMQELEMFERITKVKFLEGGNNAI